MSPRPHRVQAAGAIYHAFSAATGAEALYRDGSDRDRFLAILALAVGRYDLELHFATVLGTHHHLLFTTRKPNVAAAMQYVNGLYCRTYNRRYDRKGHLVGARYGATLVESERHGAALVPYLALNPVRAGLVDRPQEWLWSSYAGLVGLAREWSFVTPGWMLDQFDPDPTRARAALRDYVESVLVDDAATP